MSAFDVRAVGMLLRIGRDRHFDVGDALDAGDQIGARSGSRRDAARISPPTPPVGSPRSATMWRTPASRYDWITASISALGRGDAGQMRGRRQRGLGQDAPHRGVRALARRAAGAIGHRDEIRRERREPRDRLPEILLHLLGLRRKELERDADRLRPSRHLAGVVGDRAGADRARARATPRSCRRSRAPAARLRCSVTSRPAALIHCVTVSAAKPRRRCACSSRRNSRSCGAKSTTSSRPPGAARAPPRGSRARRRRGSAAPDG